MGDLPVAARRVIVATSLVGFAVWLGVLPWLRPAAVPVPATLFFVLALATEFLSVPLLRVGTVSISTIVHLAGILLLPLPTVTALAGAAVLLQQVLARAPWYKTSFNTASVVLTVAAASLSSSLLGNPLELSQGAPLLSLASLLVVALTYYLVTSNLLALLTTCLTGHPYRYVLRTNMYAAALLEVSTAVTGGLVGFIWYHAPWWTLAMLFPAAMAYLALRYLYRVLTETDSAVDTIAQIVDERDHYTFEHSNHVAEYSGLLAQAMRLDPAEVEIIVSAARVHDLGKIGVGNRALYKGSGLEEAERAEMQSHPVIGARILGHFEGYRKGVEYILHHHERWDGNGYPHRLKGEAIPRGARIIAVADAFDAMTTTRPYRQALPVEEAFARLRTGCGTQFDPIAVGHFLALEQEIRARLASRPVVLPARPPGGRPSPPQAERTGADAPPSQALASDESATPGLEAAEG